MGIKDHGYYGYAFVGARPLQFVSLVAVLGLVANFISLIARVKQKAPQELVATLVIVWFIYLRRVSPHLANMISDMHFRPMDTSLVHGLS